MKKNILISLLVGIIGAIALGGCKKNSSCDGGTQGHLLVLDKPYKTNFGPHFKDIKVTAYFYDTDENMYYIIGKVPRKIPYQSLVQAKLRGYPDVAPKTEGPVTADYTGETYFYDLECICTE